MRKAYSFLIILSFAGLLSCEPISHKKDIFHAGTPPKVNIFNEKSLQLALALADSGYFDSSNIYLSSAATYFQQLRKWPLYCECLNLLGANCLQKQDYKYATQYIARSLDTGIHYLGNASLAVAQSYNYLGELYIVQEKFTLANTMLHRSLKIRTAFLPDNHPQILECKYNLGRLSFSKNEHNEALKIEMEVLNQRCKVLGNEHKDVALTHNMLGLIYYYLDEYELSLDHYNKAEQITRHVLGKNHPQLGKIYNSLGIFYWNRNDLEQAKSYFEKAIHIYREAVGKESIAIANILANLGMVCYNAEDYESAINYYNSTLEIHLKQLGKRSVTLAKIISNRGLAYQQLGMLDEALKDNIASLEIRMSNSPDSSSKLMAPVYSNLVSIYGSKGYNSKAVEFFKKAHKIYHHPLEVFDAEINNYINNIVLLYTYQQQYYKALFFMRKTQAYTIQKFGKQSINAAEESSQIGDIWLKIGNPDSALVHYQQGIASLLPGYSVSKKYNIPTFGTRDETPFLIKLIASKANALKRIYDEKSDKKCLEAAYAHYVLLVPAINSLRQNYIGEEAKIFLNKSSQPIFNQALDCAYALYLLTQDTRYIDQAFIFSENSKAIVLLNALKDVTAHHSVGLPDSLLVKEAQLKISISFYKNLLYELSIQEGVKDNEKVFKWESKLGTLQLSYEAFVRTLEQDYPSYYQLKYKLSSYSTERVKQHLSQNRALVAYTLTDSSLYIFTITSKGQTLTRLQLHHPFANLINQFRTALQSGNYHDYTSNAYLLYQYLLAPVQQYLASVRQLTIIPDAQLGYIPFDVLLTRPALPGSKNYKDLAYVLRQFQCSYYYSATLWMEALTLKNHTGNKEMLGIAPGFNSSYIGEPGIFGTSLHKDSVRKRLLPLKWAEKEVKELSSQVEGMFLHGETATEKSFKQEAGRYSVLHIATHAVADETASAYSKLIFSEDNSSDEDGYLHTYELYNMKLHASLVTLSACNTGTGPLLKGEGVISLARGFMYAGCPNILMSLWPVNDRSTATIMKYFYEGLLNGLPKDEALYLAKNRFITQAGPLGANPYFWGSFVLVGDSTPVMLIEKKYTALIISCTIGVLLITAFILLLTGKYKAAKNGM